ncbi:hypothetical protein [Streptomyces sp. NPDC088812]|uniref:hypothetical protein n=1 Tax=Streptomyces sp. NPDC088812 TaxID=3365905 RepID=UPI0037F9C2A3
MGGSAVHEATEHYDLMSVVGNADLFKASEIWEAHFDAQLHKAREKGSDRPGGLPVDAPEAGWSSTQLPYRQAVVGHHACGVIPAVCLAHRLGGRAG